MKKLQIVKMGNEIKKEELKGDLTNHRYYIYNLDLKKEIKERYNITNKKLECIEVLKGKKHIVDEKGKVKLINDNALYINIYLKDENGIEWGCHELEHDINKIGLNYEKLYVKLLILSLTGITFNEVEEVSR